MLNALCTLDKKRLDITTFTLKSAVGGSNSATTTSLSPTAGGELGRGAHMFHQTHPVKPTDAEMDARLGAAPGLDAAAAWSAIWRRKMSIVGTIVGALIGAFLFVALVTPQYTAVTQILIDPSDLRAIDNGLTSTSQLPEASVLQAETQVRVLTSDNVLRRVVAGEKLNRDPEFAGNQDSVARRLAAGVLDAFGIELQRLPADTTLAALNELHRRVRVKRAERTYVVDVAVTTREREKSVRLANAIAQAYLEEQIAARAEAARRVSDSISARLSELQERVRQAERRVEEFKARHNIVGASGQLVNEQQLSEVNNQLVLARARTAEAKSRFEQVQRLQRSGAEIGAVTEAVQSQTITALRAQHAEVTRREAEMVTQLGSRHPAVAEIQAQARGLRRLINEEVTRIAEAARNDYERARASEESLTGSLDALKRSAMITNEALVTLRELEREVQASRAVYESFLVRARETGEQERLDTRNVRIISAADLPLRRSWPPGNVPLLLCALIIGLVAGAGLALWRGVNDGHKGPPQSGTAGAGRPVKAAVPLKQSA
jgi:polysaccharide biosynthesis transport protein